jgi:CO/xanthine dehydrogenase Mo-binding subunit
LIARRDPGEFDFSAGTGVPRVKSCGVMQTLPASAAEDFTMEITTTELRVAPISPAQSYFAFATGSDATRNERVESLDVETVASSQWLPANRKWAIRFGAGATVTIVLGMRNYGRGCFSGYFANLVADRLGIPFRRVRLYYSANLPAVLQNPLPPLTVPCGSSLGPIASAAADVIAGMCDQVIERGRVAFAAIAGVEPGDVGFDQTNGRFFVLDRDRSCGTLEMAGRVRCSGSVSVN